MNIYKNARKWPGKIAVPLYVLVLALYPQAYCQAASWTVTAEEWARPRSGQSLVQMEPLIATMQTMEPASQLFIRYPGGEEGALWASELKDWLVSLGVPSGRITIRPGQSSHENITLILENLMEDEE